MNNWKFKGLNDQWSDYFLCLFLHMLIPLLPILMEFLFTGSVLDSSLSITTAMYSIAIGLSSKNKAMFGYCLVIGIFFSGVYGVSVSTQNQIMIDIRTPTLVILGSVFLLHAAERFNRHVADCQAFLLFKNEGAEL